MIVRYLGDPVATGGNIAPGTGSAAGYTIHSFKTTGTSAFEVFGLGPSTLSGNLTGVGGIQKNGSNLLVLSGSNSFKGVTNVADGTLQLGHAQALGKSTFNGGAGTLSFGSLTAATFGGLSGSSNLALSNTSAAAIALTVGANDQSTTFAGILSGSGSLTKIGTGILELSGANSYSGPTNVNAGGLLVSGSNLGLGLVSVGSDGWIGGRGRLGGELGLSQGAELVFDPAGPLSVLGAVTIDDTFGVSSLVGVNGLPINWSLIGNGTYTLIDTASTFDNIDNFSSDNPYDIGDGRTAYFQNGSLQLVIVPEPEALALAALGIAAAAWAARRRLSATLPSGPGANRWGDG